MAFSETPEFIGGKHAQLSGQDSAYDKAVVGGVTQGNNGVLSGGATFSATRVPPVIASGRSVEFDGVDGLVTVADNAQLNAACGTGQPRTLAFWFRYTADTNLVIVEKNNNLQFVAQINVGGGISWRTDAVATGRVDSLSPVNDGNWHHYAGVHDGAENRLYIDGVLQGSAAETAPAANTNDLHIGSRGGTVAFSGTLDELLIWSRALSEEEITALAANSPSKPTDAIAYYDFDDNLIADAPAGAPAGARSMLHDGADDIEQGGGPAIAPPETYSIWFKTEDLTAIRGIWAHAVFTVGYIELLSSTQLRTRFRDTILSWTFATFNVGQWYNVIVERAADGTMRAWVDNVEASEGAQASGGTTIVDMAIIGRSGNGFWKGQLSDAVAWNKLLTVQERAAVQAKDYGQPIFWAKLDQTRNANTWQVGAWDQTLRDQAGSAHGTLVNFPSEPNTGWVEARPSSLDGHSLQFDRAANPERRVDFPVDLDGREAFTICGFIKQDDGGGTRQDVWAFDHANTSNFQLGLQQNVDQTVINFRTGGATGTVTVNDSRYKDGAWHHYAITYDGSHVILYADGAEIGRTAATGGANVNNNVGRFGIDVTSNLSRIFGGLLTEFRIYHEAKDAAAILQISAGDPGGDISSGLVLRYDFRDARHYSGPDTFAADLGTTARFPSGAAAEGICYSDDVFTGAVTFQNASQLEQVMLRAAIGHRHDGTSGTGARFENDNDTMITIGTTAPPPIIKIYDLAFRATGSLARFGINCLATVVCETARCMFYGFAAPGTICVRSGNGNPFRAYDNFFFGNNASGDITCLGGSAGNRSCEFYNNSCFQCSGTGPNVVGISISDVAIHRAENNVAIDVGESFRPAAPTLAVMAYNASSDNTASGTGSLTGLAAEDCFIGPGNGSLDLHTFPGSALQDVGTDLSGLDILEIFLDIDRDNRSTGTRDQQIFPIQPFPLAVSAAWDIGADEWVTGQPTGQAGLGAISRRRRLAGARR